MVVTDTLLAGMALEKLQKPTPFVGFPVPSYLDH